MRRQVTEAYTIAIELEEMVKHLESLVNGKQGFLKDLKKRSNDIGICRLNEDIFIAKTLSKRIADILQTVKAAIENDEVSGGDIDEIEAPDMKYNKEAYNKSKSIY